MAATNQSPPHPPTGLGVDASGGAVIDPTANVTAIVNVEKEHAQELRKVDAKLFSTKVRLSEEKLRVLQAQMDGQKSLQNWMRDSESKRLDQLSGLRETYEKRIADMLSESVRSTSALVSTQLLQIQSTFDARVSKLEEFRLLSTGRSSVADPALASSLSTLTDTMSLMANNISALKETGKTTEGRGMGRSEIVGWIVGALGALSLVATLWTHGQSLSVQPTAQYVPAPTAVPAPITVPR